MKLTSIRMETDINHSIRNNNGLVFRTADITSESMEVTLVQFPIIKRLLICGVCAGFAVGCTSVSSASDFTGVLKAPADLSCRIVAPDYPDGARQAGQGGATKVVFIVEEDGSIKKALVDKSSDNAALDDAARAAVLKGRCTPYVSEGKVHRVVETVTIRFSMSPSMRNLSADSPQHGTAGALVLERLVAARAGRDADWRTVVSYNGSRTQLDRSSLQVGDRTVNVWMRTVWDEPFKISIAFIPITEELSNIAIDCERHQAIAIMGVVSNREGPLDPPMKGGKVSKIVPDSPLAKVENQYCVK